MTEVIKQSVLWAKRNRRTFWKKSRNYKLFGKPNPSYVKKNSKNHGKWTTLKLMWKYGGKIKPCDTWLLLLLGQMYYLVTWDKCNLGTLIGIGLTRCLITPVPIPVPLKDIWFLWNLIQGLSGQRYKRVSFDATFELRFYWIWYGYWKTILCSVHNQVSDTANPWWEQG